MTTVLLDGESLSISDVINIAENYYQVDYPAEVWNKLNHSRELLIKLLYEQPEEPIYGVNRGSGDLLTAIPKAEYWKQYVEAYRIALSTRTAETESRRKDYFERYLEALEDYQERYIKAHNCGTGAPFMPHIVRAALVLRLNTFAKGYSGVSPTLCKLLIDLLNHRVTPYVLEEGSVGASGDLIPLAMVGAVILGLPEAQAYYQDKLMSASEALATAGLNPIRLGVKDAMSLTNGTSFTTALCVFALRDVERLLATASISAALALEAIRGEPSAYSESIMSVRAHRGQLKVATELRNLLAGSKRTTAEAQKVPFTKYTQTEESTRVRIQDRYSFRCIPQVHGAVYDALENLRRVITVELNSASDNPLIFQTEKTDDDNNKPILVSGGNFHCQPLATAIDYLKLSLTGLALITNKRIFSMLDKNQNFGLPQNLVIDSTAGDTGLMLAQYASASRAAECRVLSTPASITSISTASNQEDFVSMSTVGALHLNKIIYNTQIIVAIELLCALRGLQLTYELLPPELRSLGKGTAKIYDYLNAKLPLPSSDQYLRTELELIRKLVIDGTLVELVKDLLT